MKTARNSRIIIPESILIRTGSPGAADCVEPAQPEPYLQSAGLEPSGTCPIRPHARCTGPGCPAGSTGDRLPDKTFSSFLSVVSVCRGDHVSATLCRPFRLCGYRHGGQSYSFATYSPYLAFRTGFEPVTALFTPDYRVRTAECSAIELPEPLEIFVCATPSQAGGHGGRGLRPALARLSGSDLRPVAPASIRGSASPLRSESVSGSGARDTRRRPTVPRQRMLPVVRCSSSPCPER